MQKHPHNTGIGKGLGGIFIDKHAHTGFAWTKDKLGMYHGEATRRAARMGDGIASVEYQNPKYAPFALAMNTARMRQPSKGEPNRCAGKIRGILPIVARGFI